MAGREGHRQGMKEGETPSRSHGPAATVCRFRVQSSPRHSTGRYLFLEAIRALSSSQHTLVKHTYTHPSIHPYIQHTYILAHPPPHTHTHTHTHTHAYTRARARAHTIHTHVRAHVQHRYMHTYLVHTPTSDTNYIQKAYMHSSTRMNPHRNETFHHGIQCICMYDTI